MSIHRSADLTDDPATAPGLLYSLDLSERVQREARDATALPWWFVEAAVIIFVIAIAASAAWPWGWAA